MSFLDQLAQFIDKYGPAMAVFAVSYFRNAAILAKNQARIAKLESKLKENGIEVEKENAGLSAADIIRKYLKGPD